MENQNKNWVLGRPLEFGDKDQIKELARLKAIKDAKANLKKQGLELEEADFDIVRTVNTIVKFDCFECGKPIKTEIEDVDFEEDCEADNDYHFADCRYCKSEYRLTDGIIFLKD